jgi:glycosyl transferase family 25
MSENIERIVYINLDRSIERRKNIEEEIERLNLSERTERFPAILHNEGCVGCGKSHVAVLKMARDRGYKNILILEDDFQFLVSKDEFEQNLRLFFDSKIPYDVCMISYHIQRSEEVTEYPFLKCIREAQTTSGYIVNQSYYNELIQLWEDAVIKLECTGQHWIYSIDQIWKSLQKKDIWYCFSTRIGKQRPGWSEIAHGQHYNEARDF